MPLTGCACLRRVPLKRYKTKNWRVDQEALYYVYLNKRRFVKKALSNMDIHSHNAGIEDTATIEKLFGNCRTEKEMPCQYAHYFIPVTLMKYKKVQQYLMARQTSIVKWKSFLIGTHPQLGSESPVLMLRGNRAVLEKIQNMVVNNELIGKIVTEKCVITKYL